MANSSIQKFFKALLPKSLADSMEAESRSWMVQCPNCKYERSVWDLGGIRWMAAGNPQKYRICTNCNKRSWLSVYKKSGDKKRSRSKKGHSR